MPLFLLFGTQRTLLGIDRELLKGTFVEVVDEYFPERETGPSPTEDISIFGVECLWTTPEEIGIIVAWTGEEDPLTKEQLEQFHDALVAALDKLLPHGTTTSVWAFPPIFGSRFDMFNASGKQGWLHTSDKGTYR